MSQADAERVRVATNLASRFAQPHEIHFGASATVRVRVIRDTTSADLSVEFQHDGKTLRTAFAFQAFNNLDFDESYGLAIQNPLKPSAKFSRLQVFIEGSGRARRHMAGTIPFRLTTSELAEPVLVRDLLVGLGHAADTPFRLWQCTHPFDVLEQNVLVPGMIEYLRFTLVLMCFRWKDKSSGVRFRDVPSLAMLAALGAKLDNLATTLRP